MDTARQLLAQMNELGAQAAQRIRAHVLETPLELSPPLSRMAGGQVYIKLECFQRTGSFKLRGAMNKVLSLTAKERACGVIAASTGNHGLAVARAAAAVGSPCTIYLPEDTAPSKLDALREQGAKVELFGTDCEQTERLARAYAEDEGCVFVSPYNDADVVTGQATVGVEIARQLEGGVDALFASVGGGGLIAGVGGHLRTAYPQIEIVGCWPQNSPALYECLREGRIIEVESKPTLSDATAGGVEPDAITFELCRELIDQYALVDEGDIRNAIRFVLKQHRIVIEGAAGVAVAAFLHSAEEYRGKTVVIVLCGRNIELDVLRSCLR